MTLYAYTPPGHNPPYLNVSENEDGSVRVTVRGEMREIITDAVRGSTKWDQQHASIDIASKQELVLLFAALGGYLYGEDVMAITGKVIFQLLTSTPPESISAAADNAVAIAEDLAESMEGSSEYHRAHDALMEGQAAPEIEKSPTEPSMFIEGYFTDRLNAGDEPDHSEP